MNLSLAYSTCPNDTFTFDAMVNGRIAHPFSFDIVMEDILHLNRRAISAQADVVKVSYNTMGRIMNDYQLLRAGSAMGKGCGPLLVAKPGTTLEDLHSPDAVIAIPGFNTTANLLLSYFAPGLTSRREMLFHEVMPAVERGEATAGLIIHENRFTYPQHGLISLVDLGAFWESQTGLPIPLGAIAAKKSLGKETIGQIETLIRQSVEYAFANPAASAEYVKAHAQEMEPDVCRMHIELYVNSFSIDFGKEGEQAIAELFRVGIKEGILPNNAVDELMDQLQKGVQV